MTQKTASGREKASDTAYSMGFEPGSADERPTEGKPPRRSRTAALLKRKPTMAVMMAGAAGLIAANVVGVGEMAIAIAAGYAAYRMLRS